MILASMCLSGHGGEPGAGEVPILGSDEEPGARGDSSVAFSDVRVTVSFRRGRLYWKEATGVQHFPGGVEKKAEPGLRGRRKVTDRELGTRRAYGIP